MPDGRRPCQATYQRINPADNSLHEEPCGFWPYRPASIPSGAVFCWDCDRDNSRRDAVLAQEEVFIRL